MKSIRSPAFLNKATALNLETRRTRQIALSSFGVATFTMLASVGQAIFPYLHSNDSSHQILISHQLTYCANASQELAQAILVATDFAQFRLLLNKGGVRDSDLNGTPQSRAWSKTVLELGQMETEWQSLFGENQPVADAIIKIQDIAMGDPNDLKGTRFSMAYESQQNAIIACYHKISELRLK